ncbi:MAG TPA: hypothetical protein VLV86_24120 [Vicinamibacterales bacterium]|nr:hypothetical protein [Thermoanaerobaculia bacterium]HUK37032.1 hypothetical protein [Vicinamibacterales bacterium]
MGHRHEFHEVKREFERVHFEHPIPGRLSGQPVALLDLAIGGARLLGTTRVQPASTHELRIEWEGETIQLRCVITRCVIQVFGAKQGAKSTYEIGARITESVGDSDRVMHHLIATFVLKAIEEQRANWNGLPPVGPYVHIEGKTGRYRRCQMLNGDWQISETTRPEQPINGFTVSAEVPPRYLQMLCQTYEKTDDEGRRLTRILAELSINKSEGVPTRRYIP